MGRKITLPDPKQADPFAINAQLLGRVAELEREVAALQARIPQVWLPLPARAEISRVEQAVLRALRAGGIRQSQDNVTRFVWVWGEICRAAATVGRHRTNEREGLVMTVEEFRERVEALIGEAEDAGLSLPEMIEVMDDKVQAMKAAVEE